MRRYKNTVTSSSSTFTFTWDVDALSGFVALRFESDKSASNSYVELECLNESK